MRLPIFLTRRAIDPFCPSFALPLQWSKGKVVCYKSKDPTTFKRVRGILQLLWPRLQRMLPGVAAQFEQAHGVGADGGAPVTSLRITRTVPISRWVGGWGNGGGGSVAPRP